jgi:DedD protein
VDRHLKERLVGAVVLIAAAQILIPPMLSGSKTPPKAGADLATSENSAEPSKLKTYSIDLSKSTVTAPSESLGVHSSPEAAATSFAEQVSTTAAPPPEQPIANQSPPVANSSKPAAEPSRERVANTTPEPTRSQPDPRKENAPSGGWSVQVGSFGVRATSDRVAADLKKEGFSAFVVAFQSGNQTMYRVRVGPERDRAAAEVLLRKLKLHHPGATLVPPA